MLDRLLALLDRVPAAPPDTVGGPFQRGQIAAVALLIEIAQSDRRVPPEESAAIERIVRTRFRLDPAAAARLIAAAQAELDAALEDWVFAKAVREGFEAREVVEIVGLLWEIVYADGKLARLEESQMRRVAQALGVSDADRDAARAQAFARSRSAGSETGEAE